MSRLASIMGTIAAVALLVIGLWGWGMARPIAEHVVPGVAINEPDRARDAILWALRSGAIAAIAAAQVLGIHFAVGAVFRRRDKPTEVAKLLAGFVCTAALIGAIALSVIGR